MITNLFIVMLLVGQMVSNAPPVSPEEAVRILRDGHSDLNWTDQRLAPWAEGWVHIIHAAGPTLGPWPFPSERPARRLDGTLLSQEPTVYGLPPFSVPLFGVGPYSFHAWPSSRPPGGKDSGKKAHQQ